MDSPTREDFEALGWNSIDVNNPANNARVLAHQLSLLGVVLVEIRDELRKRER